MRKLLLVFLLLFSSPCFGAVAYVDGNVNNTDYGNLSVGTSAASQVTGNYGVACVSVDEANGASAITGVSDSAGSTWTKKVSATNANGYGALAEIWITTNMLGSNATVTATIDANGPLAIATAFYSGGSSFGATTNTASNNTDPVSISLTTDDANDYVIGCMGMRSGSGASWSASTGNLRQFYNCNGSPGPACVAVVDNTAGSATSVTVAATQGGSIDWAASAVEIRVTAPAAGRKRQVVIQ